MRRALAALALLAAACQPRTEVVVGLLTDLPVPGSLASVDLETDRAGVPIDRRDWPASDGPLLLPGSYGLYSSDGTAPAVTIILSGFLGTLTPIARRTVDLSLISGRTLFLRLALVRACVNHAPCPADQNCVEGACVSESLDARTLPDYSPALAATVECDSGTRFIDASTGDELPVAGACPPGQKCQEGLCYLQP
jgi:hypothetical protein